RIETYVIVPPEPIHVYLYRCDARFHTEYLQEMLREKETYGILLVDSSGATLATLQGRRLEIIRELTSGVPGKTRAGGQSARRYERFREMRLQEYFTRVGEHANETFLPIENLKGLIIGGPGPTKYDFEKGEYLNYMLKNKIIDTIDTAYVEEQGVKEVVEKAPEVMRKVRFIEEKKVVQQFLYEVGHDTGKITYGEEDVRRALEAGAVHTLLLSEGLDMTRVTLKCSACSYQEQHTVKNKAIAEFEQGLIGKPCPKCKAPALNIVDKQDLIDDFAKLAEYTNATVEIISTETEEGQMLKNSFGGVAAILRFKLHEQ
ncbi:MAG TPA: peptide chain release factor aRF-1, partial [Candidatus Acidoferrales bacterium]|nr:peptide chain release factor aRF-1 [Candidatus Acidoferrales bacterium]